MVAERYIPMSFSQGNNGRQFLLKEISIILCNLIGFVIDILNVFDTVSIIIKASN